MDPDTTCECAFKKIVPKSLQSLFHPAHSGRPFHSTTNCQLRSWCLGLPPVEVSLEKPKIRRGLDMQ